RLASSIRAAVATGENLTGLEQYRSLLDAGGVGVVQAGAVWGITHFLRVAVMAHSRDLPVSPVGLTANHSVTAAAAAVPNHLTAEIQDLGQPFGLTLDQQFEDGGVVLGDKPGVGIELDERAIEHARIEGAWGILAGPHVRSPRAGLSLSLDGSGRR
ncbi:MAG TPA: enolase C-terminal domain-like protein, partial [Microbacterium sp.]|nr:enolase C-terminal domain-like protein [Microbacterium sp.]